MGKQRVLRIVLVLFVVALVLLLRDARFQQLCRWWWQAKPVATAGNGSGPAADPLPRPAPVAASQSITIATFNIQVFGQSKAGKTEVMDALAEVIRRFDVVAIQEVRSAKQDVLPRLVERVNADGSAYDFLIGERLGRTSSKEQYAFVYNTARIEALPRTMYTASDPGDRLHREPLVATFRVRGPPADRAFSFTLVNIHTDPDETDQELDALDDVFQAVRQGNRSEDDVILLGDLNVDADHLGQLGQLPNITWVIPAAVPTNTRGTRSYDNIVFDQTATAEYTGQAGVLNLETELGLTRERALQVSDHLPVWAVFTATEAAAAQIASPLQQLNR